MSIETQEEYKTQQCSICGKYQNGLTVFDEMLFCDRCLQGLKQIFRKQLHILRQLILQQTRTIPKRT